MKLSMTFLLVLGVAFGLTPIHKSWAAPPVGWTTSPVGSMVVPVTDGPPVPSTDTTDTTDTGIIDVIVDTVTATTFNPDTDSTGDASTEQVTDSVTDTVSDASTESVTDSDVVTSAVTGTNGDETTVTSTTGTTESTTETTTNTVTSTTTTGSSSGTNGTIEHKWEPLFYLTFDCESYIVNLTPQFMTPPPMPKNNLVKYNRPAERAAAETLVVDDFRYGFQKSIGGSIAGGVGGKIEWWYANASGLKNAFWGYVGILPVAGTSTYSKRYTRSYSSATDMGGRWKLPTGQDLYKWDLGDSIKYVTDGGLVFSAGVGLDPAGIGVAAFAQGSWEVYVEKVSANEAYVKISKGQLRGLSLFTNLAISTLSKNLFGSRDNSFSYIYNFKSDVGRKAFEDMIHGSVLASEQIASKYAADYIRVPPLMKIETIRTVSTGSLVNFNMHIPIIWNLRYSKGNVNSFTSSDVHFDKSTVQVNYGIYTKSNSNRFFYRHVDKSQNFYGAKYSVMDWKTKSKRDGEFGRYYASYDRENSDPSDLRTAIEDLVKQTGQGVLRVNVPNAGKLGYVGYKLVLNFSQDNTRSLMSSVSKTSESSLGDQAAKYINQYVQGGDYMSLCPAPHQGDGASGRDWRPDCVRYLDYMTRKGVAMMYSSIKDMNKYYNRDSAAFATAYGEFGEGMATNMFTFNLGKKLAGSDLLMSYMIQGARLSMYLREWKTDSNGNWIPFVYSEDPNRKLLDPRLIHSELRKDLLLKTKAKRPVPLP